MNAVNKGALVCVLQGCALGAAMFFGTVPAASAAQAVSCSSARVSTFDARLAAKAARGPAELGRFVRQVGPVYQLDYATAVARVERVQRNRASCDAVVASK